MGLAERLRYARESANLTGAQVHERTGVGGSSLSDFENGKREPKLSQLKALGLAYRRPLSFFLSEEPIASEAVLWRERPASRADEIEGEFLELCRRYHNLETWCGEPATGTLPAAKADAASFSYGDAEALAKRVRDDLQLGDQPGHELLRVLEERCRVKVFFRSYEPTGAAACTLSEAFGPAVLLNSENVRWRRNHDLAHELFHLLTWTVFRIPTQAPAGASEREEKLAMCFARNLLMPPEPVRAEYVRRTRHGRISFESLFDIARLFDVSVESLIWQLHFVYQRGQDKQDQTMEIIAGARQLAPTLEDRERDTTPTPPLPERYRALAFKALRHGEVSVGRFAQYMGISRQKAMAYVQQEIDTGEEVQLAPA